MNELRSPCHERFWVVSVELLMKPIPHTNVCTQKFCQMSILEISLVWKLQQFHFYEATEGSAIASFSKGRLGHTHRDDSDVRQDVITVDGSQEMSLFILHTNCALPCHGSSSSLSLGSVSAFSRYDPSPNCVLVHIILDKSLLLMCQRLMLQR